MKAKIVGVGTRIHQICVVCS